jgi:hypothetical protein
MNFLALYVIHLPALSQGISSTEEEYNSTNIYHIRGNLNAYLSQSLTLRIYNSHPSIRNAVC